ncbi:MAG TPA: EexN family lipoprotein [Gammaproteobacteria bacterium]|nr:EexN family lipoprotein [Gammaproteobacteria bacterium]
MNQYLALRLPAPKARFWLGMAGFGLLLAGCEAPPPRSFTDFMDDRIAREGTLAHCNQNPVATAEDIECANARRAAATIALRAERERREELERESERKLEALRNEMAERERIVRESTLAAARAEREAYESLWRSGAGNRQNAEAAAGEVGPPRDRLSLIVLPPRE